MIGTISTGVHMKARCQNLVAAVVVVVIALTTEADASAPAGRYTIGGGTVYDTKTKLTWQQASPSTKYGWTDAKSYCAGLGATLGGTGWRLPTIKELLTIVDYSSQVDPLIDATAFPATPQIAAFLSSTPVAGLPDTWLVVTFAIGEILGSSGADYVRCVR
jgi:hypothetical protein